MARSEFGEILRGEITRLDCTSFHGTVELMFLDKVQSLTDSVEKERESRLLAEQRAQDASLRVDVLSSYFNEKEKELDRYLPLVLLMSSFMSSRSISHQIGHKLCYSVSFWGGAVV